MTNTLSIELLMLNDLLSMQAVDEEIYAMAAQKIRDGDRSADHTVMATA